MASMAEPRWLNAEEQQAWRAFLAANRLLIEALDRELQRDAGLPHTYYEILVQLSESPERTMRMSDLAARSLSSTTIADSRTGSPWASRTSPQET